MLNTMITNSRLSELIVQKQIIIRKAFNGEITEKDCEQQIIPIELQIKEITEKHIQDENANAKKLYSDLAIRQKKLEQERKDDKEKRRVEKMAEIETKVAEAVPVKVRKQRTPKVPKVPKAPKVPKEKKQRVGIEHHRKDGKPTMVSVVLDVLQMKSIKNKTAAVDKIMEKLPGSDKKKVEAQLAVTLHMLKHGKGRMAKYNWDLATYTLTPKA